MLLGAGIFVSTLSGCAGIFQGYSREDIRRDGLRLLPPGAHNLSYGVLVGDGFNRTMSATFTFRARSGTAKERVAQYIAIARQHGWRFKTHSGGPYGHYTALENGHAYLSIRTDIGLVSRIDSFHLVMTDQS